MDLDNALALATSALSLVFLALLTAAEAAFVSSNKSHAHALASRSVPGASSLARLLERRHQVVASLSTARALSIVVSVALGLALAYHQYGIGRTAVVIGLVAGFLAVGIVQALSRTIVHQSPQRWALRLAPFIRIVKAIFSPVAWILGLPGQLLVRLRVFRVHPGERADEDEDFFLMMERENGSGAIEEEERAMIRAVLDLPDTTAREIMVPRIDIAAVVANESVGDVLKLIVERGFSRIPVYEETIDNVVGVVYAKDLLPYIAEGRKLDSLKDIARAPYFIPESKRVDELLSELRQHRVHIAIVVDEYGGTAGLVTIEDLLEEIVGEIEDEFDREEATIERIADDEAILDARVSIDELNEMFGLEIEGEDFDTVGGFVYHRLGRVPLAGDEVREDGVNLRVLSVLGRRIKKVRVSRLKTPAVEG